MCELVSSFVGKISLFYILPWFVYIWIVNYCLSGLQYASVHTCVIPCVHLLRDIKMCGFLLLTWSGSFLCVYVYILTGFMCEKPTKSRPIGLLF